MKGHESLVIDQREIQRRGGKCVKFPVSCLVHDMIVDVFGDVNIVVLDTTYGEGRFYGAFRPLLLLGTDIKIHNWVVKPDWFSLVPSWSAWRMVDKLMVSPDLIVVDPPWTSYTHRGRKHYYEYRGLGDAKMVLEGAFITARKLGVRYILIHYKDRVVPRDGRILYEKYFIYVSRYLKNNDIKNNPNKTWFGIIERV